MAARMTAAASVAAMSFGLAFAPSAAAQAPPAAGPVSPAKQAIDVRKAIFTLINSNFKPVGNVLQGKAEYDAADLSKRARRVVFLADLLNEAFPDISSAADTRAKPEIWKNRADFDKKLKDFQDHAAALAQVLAKEKTGSDTFKAAAVAVGQDCKGCHESYKTK